MAKRMLIDATHTEETRVAVVDGNRLVNFDYESQMRKQLKGSIFLAKVTRVEPSLQAAFVNFGGNRHGFLPFTEIHPDYFRIPIADREALIAEQEREMEARRAAEEAEEDEEEMAGGEDPATEEAEEDDEDDVEEVGGEAASDDGDEDSEEKNDSRPRRGKGRGRGRRQGRRAASGRRVEIVGGDGIEGDQPVRPTVRKNYKIQEVVKRGQIMLVQVSKEERGNKGAAVTTYLSLPGRYCVLMPNSPRAGGVSRKIANYKERKRMREILKELNVPQGMSVIMRTAGVARTKTEIKRDLDYLMRLWDNIRTLTLESTAPSLVHEEGKLIRRSIRDIYDKDIEEILVSGADGHKLAKDFMKMLIPSHVKRVTLYEDEFTPLFQRYQVEKQVSEIGDPVVTLPSGGYLVINPTEALVSVDVNSGRATKERHIEETALRTNLEAATEVARQLRLRDLGGLVVIDFIDMEDRRNNRKVENRMKEALSNDRARIQIGRISSFGLMELSRQRLNPSLTEAQFERCTACEGVGVVRSVDSTAINALRALEEEGVRARADDIILHLTNNVALYMLNNKRNRLNEIEKRYGFQILIKVDDTLATSKFVVEPVKKQADKEDDDTETNGQQASKEKAQTATSPDQQKDDDEGGRKQGRRRGRRGGRRRGRRDDNESASEDGGQNQQQSESTAKEPATEEVGAKDSVTDQANNPKEAADDGDKDKKAAKKAPSRQKKPVKAPKKAAETDTKTDEAADAAPPKKKAAGAVRKAKTDDSQNADEQAGEKVEKQAKPRRKSTAKKAGDADQASAAEEKPAVPSNDVSAAPKDYETVNEKPDKKRKGWWNRLS